MKRRQDVTRTRGIRRRWLPRICISTFTLAAREVYRTSFLRSSTQRISFAGLIMGWRSTYARKLTSQSNVPRCCFEGKVLTNSWFMPPKGACAVLAGSRRTCSVEPQPVPISSAFTVNLPSLHYYTANRLKKAGGEKDKRGEGQRADCSQKGERDATMRQGGDLREGERDGRKTEAQEVCSCASILNNHVCVRGLAHHCRAASRVEVLSRYKNNHPSRQIVGPIQHLCLRNRQTEQPRPFRGRRYRSDEPLSQHHIADRHAV